MYKDINKKICLGSIDEKWFEKNIVRENNMYLFLKRAIDIFFGCVGFILFSLFFPFVAVLIKVDSKGPIFYCHKRVGKNGIVFDLYKFRSMTSSSDQHSAIWREKDKDNITRVGKFLRRSHIDELPQAINLLRGDISFVGPRPEWVELVKIFEEEIPFYKKRYLIKPGLFGWAQINFPASKTVDEAKEKFEYDLYYIKNYSILLDIEIMLKAVKLFLW